MCLSQCCLLTHGTLKLQYYQRKTIDIKHAISAVKFHSLHLQLCHEAESIRLFILPIDRADVQVWQTTILTSEEESFRDQAMRHTIGFIEISFWRSTETSSSTHHLRGGDALLLIACL